MSCEIYRHEMAAYLQNKMTTEARRALEAHLRTCEGCNLALAEAGEAWQALDAWKEAAMPENLARAIKWHAQQAVLGEQNRAVSQPARSWLRGIVPVQSLALGLGAALVSAVVIGARSRFDLHHPLALIAAGAVWVVVYGVVFSLFSAGRENMRMPWKFLARASLVAAGVFLLFTYLSPVPASIAFCSRYTVMQSLVERLSVAGSYFLFGGLYALVPMGLAAFISLHRNENYALVHGSIAGVMFALLLIPGIVMQCAPFAFGVLLGWFSGALAGSVLGGALGYWLRAKLS